MSSPDLFLQRMTLIIMMAMSVMPATAAITIQRVLFFSPPAPAWAAAALVSVGAGELNPAEEENKELPYVIASPQTSFGVRLSCIHFSTNEPQRTSAGKLLM